MPIINTTSPLTKAIIEFNSGKTSEIPCSISDSLIMIGYYHPIEKNFIPEEEASGFLLFMMPRFRSIVTRFTYKGISFECYFKKLLYWQSRSYLSDVSRKEIRSRIYSSILVQDTSCMMYEESKFSYDEKPIGSVFLKRILKCTNSDKQKLLVLLLVYADLFTAESISVISSTLDVSEEWLEQSMMTLKKSLDPRYGKVCKARERITHYYFSKIVLHWNASQANSLSQGSSFSQKYSEQIIAAEKHLAYAREALPTAKGKVSYSAIAELLDLPTGTVASKIYSARKILDKLLLTEK